MAVIIRHGNFSNGKKPPEADEYRNCNFSFTSPIDNAGVKTGHIIFPNNTKPLLFYSCNMRNCIPPDNAVLTNCITPIIEDFEAEVIDGKVCTGDRLFGYTDRDTKKAVYKAVPKIMSKPNNNSDLC